MIKFKFIKCISAVNNIYLIFKKYEMHFCKKIFYRFPYAIYSWWLRLLLKFKFQEVL